jgi:hypothetical protein
MRRFVITLAILGAAAGLSGCDESLTSPVAPTPDLEPTFTSIQRLIFENADSAGREACVNCHTNIAGTPGGNLTLSNALAYDQLVNVPSVGRPGVMRVRPGDPEASYLIHKLEGRSTIEGLRMPLNPPFLTAGQVDVIRRWIQNGAARN